MKISGLKTLLLTLTTFFLLPLAVGGEFYQYEDDSGTVNFTDNPTHIPKKYQKKKKTHEYDVDDPQSSVTRIRFIQNQVLVPVTVSYRGTEVKATFLLDTGAATCTISPELARRLSVNPRDGGVGLAQGVGGSVHLVGHATLDSLVVGPNRKYDIRVSVISSGRNDGLLGMNFLQGLRYHIDYDSLLIRWGD